MLAGVETSTVAEITPNIGDLCRPMKKAAIALLKQTGAVFAEVSCMCGQCGKEQPILSIGKNKGIGQNGYYDHFCQHVCAA